MSKKKHKCPLCKTDMDKVIFVGLPGKLCQNIDCNCLIGLAEYAPAIEDDDGYFRFMPYEGNYWKALWCWLFGGGDG